MIPSLPPWLEVAEKELGVAELPGTNHNKRIIEYHQAVTLKATTDETPWCASFVNWVMLQCNISGTLSAAARSWLTWGVGLSQKYPAFGSVVILSRGDNPAQGHVGFYVGANDSKTVRVLGGNQGDKVSIVNFPKSKVLSYRWPSA